MSCGLGIQRIDPLDARLFGTVRVPGDKSLSHRAVLMAAAAQGTTRLSGLPDSLDVRSCIAAVSELGAQVDLRIQPDGSLAGTIRGWGAQGPCEPEGTIDCGNSGTTARLLMGLLASWDVRVHLIGDESLCGRPMRRITAPLEQMGVRFEPAAADRLPLSMQGSRSLKAVHHTSPVASAQLKSAVLLAGMGACGTTSIDEPAPSRNHTELMLETFGADSNVGNCTASVCGPCILHAPESELLIPGDPSSAAYPLCAALLAPESFIQVLGVCLNPTRTGFARVLKRMGASVETWRTSSAGAEPVGGISARFTPNLHGCEVPAEEIPQVIDEIPVLALVAATACGTTVFREASELRVKESDRAVAIMEGLAQLGVSAWMDGNDLYVEGKPGLRAPEGLVLDACGDHRLAMTWALAGMFLGAAIGIRGFDCVNISYPSFLHTFERLTS